jgi:hypothetical protein
MAAMLFGRAAARARTAPGRAALALAVIWIAVLVATFGVAVQL